MGEDFEPFEESTAIKPTTAPVTVGQSTSSRLATGCGASRPASSPPTPMRLTDSAIRCRSPAAPSPSVLIWKTAWPQESTAIKPTTAPIAVGQSTCARSRPDSTVVGVELRARPSPQRIARHASVARAVRRARGTRSRTPSTCAPWARSAVGSATRLELSSTGCFLAARRTVHLSSAGEEAIGSVRVLDAMRLHRRRGRAARTVVLGRRRSGAVCFIDVRGCLRARARGVQAEASNPREGASAVSRSLGCVRVTRVSGRGGLGHGVSLRLGVVVRYPEQRLEGAFFERAAHECPRRDLRGRTRWRVHVVPERGHADELE